MRNKFYKMLALALCAASIIIAGCEEQNLSDVKKARLVAVENSRLMKELEKQKELHQEEIEQQKKFCDIELNRQKILLQEEIETYKKSLAECSQRDEKLLQKEAKEELQDLSQQVLKDFEEIIKLREENENLKSQIILLEDQLKQLKAEPE